MKFVKELTDRQRQKLRDALEGWDDTKAVRRVRAIWMSSQGWTVPEIADALDVWRRTVRVWIDKYDEAGLEGIKTKDRSGRPPKADEQYVERLEEVVQTPPREFGYPFSTWTREYLAMHMEKETGTSISARHVGRLLNRLGFVYKRARYDLSHKRDREEYEQKKKELGGLKKGLSA
jgi:transposase